MTKNNLVASFVIVNLSVRVSLGCFVFSVFVLLAFCLDAAFDGSRSLVGSRLSVGTGKWGATRNLPRGRVSLLFLPTSSALS